ncbi:CHRD domain-containing protein [Nonomuraea maritima]|uniref:CHRD domain-containing protein n=1 Tax=Nonomuraea maritima TaxID=683260 RepID=A0A1G9DX28_9ACTN|nr:CHRD domain-containing protein [Nonomuraea maritima]SDK68404.1 CHRD domain-containing protein [Nonomuraea maritima]
MNKRALALPGALIAAGLVAGALAPAAQADSSPYAAPVYFAAKLVGKNEVPVKGGPKVGDKDGSAFAVFVIDRDKVSYAIRWNKTDTPSMFHIHQGKAGKNGDVKIGFFMDGLPKGTTAVSGTVKVTDKALLAGIRNNPQNWYANLHTGEFPGGAVRAQLYRIKPVNLASLLAIGNGSRFHVKADGKQEIPAPGQKVGDKNGFAEWLFDIKGSKIEYATLFSGISAPTMAHIHSGPKGKNGPVAVQLFADMNGLPAGVNGLAGVASIKKDTAKGISRNAKNWYANLHTGEFPGGAVRGQLWSAKGAW